MDNLTAFVEERVEWYKHRVEELITKRTNALDDYEKGMIDAKITLLENEISQFTYALKKTGPTAK